MNEFSTVVEHDLLLDGSFSFLLFIFFFYQSTLNIHMRPLWYCILLSDPFFHIPVVPQRFCLVFFLKCVAVLSTSPIANLGDTVLATHDLKFNSSHLYLSTLKLHKRSGDSRASSVSLPSSCPLMAMNVLVWRSFSFGIFYSRRRGGGNTIRRAFMYWKLR